MTANGLSHHVLEWAAKEHENGPTVVLVHGFMDAARTWSWVAENLSAQGLRVLAPDMRGFGEGPRVPPGAYYHFADYVLDLTELLETLAPNEPVMLVGHSMGGAIATLYAASQPERVRRLVNLEGLGPPDNDFATGALRLGRWLSDMRAAKGRQEQPLARDEALRRLKLNHAYVSPDVLEKLVDALARSLPDGRVMWRFDSLHRTTSPTPFFAQLFAEYAKKVECPTLFVSGGAKGYHPPDEAERLTAFRTIERRELPEAGHMMHWTQPADLAKLIASFVLST